MAKERDLNNFMDSFPSRRAEKTREAQEKQDGIVALLDKIAKLQGLAGSALPSQKKFKEMQVRDVVVGYRRGGVSQTIAVGVPRGKGYVPLG